jgi:tRNA (uracil-5-)-methyltransferase
MLAVLQLCEDEFMLGTCAIQVNTSAAALVYKLVQSLAVRSNGTSQANTCILDVCCGTGTIGIILAPHAAHVVGIDNNLQNIESAKANALANGVENISFVHGAAEKVIDYVLEEDKVVTAAEVVAVVDPPRSGMLPVFFLF